MSIDTKKLATEKAAEIISAVKYTKHHIGMLTIYLCDGDFTIVMCGSTGEAMLIQQSTQSLSARRGFPALF